MTISITTLSTKMLRRVAFSIKTLGKTTFTITTTSIKTLCIETLSIAINARLNVTAQNETLSITIE